MEKKLEDLDGVGAATAQKLRKAGFTTVEAVAVTPLRELIQRTKLGEKTAYNVNAVARELIALDFVTAKELWEKRKDMMRCSTGSEKLDDLFAGGIETKALTEFIGAYGVGKTQLCLKLCVMAQLPRDQGGLEGNALFLDTEGTFMPERIHQIASAMGLDPEQILDRIIVSRAYTSDHQCLLIDHLFKICPEENIRLVVVDSMISHFRGEYVGRENLAPRQQKLNQYLHKLVRLSEAYNIAVVVTNQVQANPTQFFGDPNRPAGGHVMAHACTHRVYIRKSKKGSRSAKIIDSPCLPESSALFKITEKGIEDMPDAD